MTAGERYTSDSQRNGFGQEQRFSIPSSPRCALNFCSSLSLHLVNSIVLFSEQWNGLSGSSVLSGVFVLWNKWTDGSKKRRGKKAPGQRSTRCVFLNAFACMWGNLWTLVSVCVCTWVCFSGLRRVHGVFWHLKAWQCPTNRRLWKHIWGWIWGHTGR